MLLVKTRDQRNIKSDKKYEKGDTSFSSSTSPTLSEMIDDKIEEFFADHLLRVRYGNKSKEDIDIGRMLDIAEGRKKNKGGGGGGGNDGGKKKMMVMAMMMMKMKLMMVSDNFTYIKIILSPHRNRWPIRGLSPLGMLGKY